MNRPDAARLLAVTEATWPAALTDVAGPWAIRTGLGGGKRVSAATTPVPVTGADIDLAEHEMQQRGQRPLFMIRDGNDDLDSALAARGYEVIDRTLIYVIQAKALGGALPPLSGIRNWPALEICREIWAEGGIGPARIAVMERAVAPRTCLLGRVRDRPAGTAFVALDGDVAMIHAIETLARFRRQGVARNLLCHAANWTIEQGGTWLSLLTTGENLPSNALYRSLGMLEIGQYHYRIAPDSRSNDR